jgi:hypothetical protein
MTVLSMVGSAKLLRSMRCRPRGQRFDIGRNFFVPSRQVPANVANDQSSISRQFRLRQGFNRWSNAGAVVSRARDFLNTSMWRRAQLADRACANGILRLDQAIAAKRFPSSGPNGPVVVRSARIAVAEADG